MKVEINRITLSQIFDKNQKILFVHVPKCGGTSLDALIKKHIRFNRFRIDASASFRTAERIDEEVENVRNVLLNYAVYQGYKYITGHCYMHNPEQFDEFKIITVLRDPVMRFVSHYLYNRYKTHSAHDAINLDFEDFLNSDLATNYGDLYCRYFSANRTVTESISTLKKFSYVGILENLTPITSYISEELKVSGKIKKQNKNPTKSNKESQEILSKYKDEISKHCCDDIEIYNHFTT